MDNICLFVTATLPWRSVDAGCPMQYPAEPQCNIDRCLNCKHPTGCCDRCDGKGNIHKKGRSYDPDLLREMLRLKVCPEDIARCLGVSRATCFRYIRRLRNERACV